MLDCLVADDCGKTLHRLRGSVVLPVQAKNAASPALHVEHAQRQLEAARGLGAEYGKRLRQLAKKEGWWAKV